MTAFVYRFFDGDGVLLYVGHTVNLGARIRWHLANQSWAFLSVRIDVQIFPSRKEAMKNECSAIDDDAPFHNRRAGPGSFDRNAYQREYMKGYRRRQKEAKE